MPNLIQKTSSCTRLIKAPLRETLNFFKLFCSSLLAAYSVYSSSDFVVLRFLRQFTFYISTAYNFYKEHHLYFYIFQILVLI